jgi:hypothetical protein
MKKLLLYTSLLVVISTDILAQNFSDPQTPCTTASQGKAGKFVINYTIGEMVLVDSWKTNGLYITQGMLQPVTSLNAKTFECFSRAEVLVYPNPNPGVFSLQLSILKPGKIQTSLFDGSGRILQTDAFPYDGFMLKKFSIHNFPNGVYYLQLFFTQTGSDKPKKCVYTIQKSN